MGRSIDHHHTLRLEAHVRPKLGNQQEGNENRCCDRQRATQQTRLHEILFKDTERWSTVVSGTLNGNRACLLALPVILSGRDVRSAPSHQTCNNVPLGASYRSPSSGLSSKSHYPPPSCRVCEETRDSLSSRGSIEEKDVERNARMLRIAVRVNDR